MFDQYGQSGYIDVQTNQTTMTHPFIFRPVTVVLVDLQGVKGSFSSKETMVLSRRNTKLTKVNTASTDLDSTVVRVLKLFPTSAHHPWNPSKGLRIAATVNIKCYVQTFKYLFLLSPIVFIVSFSSTSTHASQTCL